MKQRDGWNRFSCIMSFENTIQSWECRIHDIVNEKFRIFENESTGIDLILYTPLKDVKANRPTRLVGWYGSNTTK